MISPPAAPALPVLPTAPPPPPVFAQSPMGQKPGKKSQAASFLNSTALPSPGVEGGGKKLTGE